MKYRMRDLPRLTIDTDFGSEREWLDHLRILAELPYPSLALMTSILPVMRCRVASTLGGFGWTDRELNPRAYMTEHMNERAYRWWIENLHVAFTMFPLRDQWSSRGEIIRQGTSAPGFEDGDFCREILVSQGLRWMALAPVCLANGDGYGFLSVYRGPERGPFTDAEQACLARGVGALAPLDRPDNPLSVLPPCPLKEADQTTLAIQPDGAMLARSEEAMRLIYLQGGANMFTLEWARPDWLALPDPVREATRALFDSPDREARRKIDITQPWGRFDFALEKVSTQQKTEKPVVMVGIRYHEAVDITVARRLAGWPLSPREKQILVASTHTTNLTEIAGALGITVNTLKSYNKELVDRLGIESRLALIELLLGDEAAEHDLALSRIR